MAEDIMQLESAIEILVERLGDLDSIIESYKITHLVSIELSKEKRAIESMLDFVNKNWRSDEGTGKEAIKNLKRKFLKWASSPPGIYVFTDDNFCDLRLVIEAAERSKAKTILSFLQKVRESSLGTEDFYRCLSLGSDNQLTAFIEKVLEGEAQKTLK